MERHHEKPARLGEIGKLLRGGADLARARQEDEDVAACPRDRRAPHRRHHLLRQAAIVGSLEMLDLHRIAPSFAPHDGTGEEGRDRFRLQGRRHDGELQIRPRGPHQPRQKRKREIAVQVALVEFVEHHRSHAGQRRIAEQAPGENGFRQEAQAGVRSGDVLEADLVPDRLAQLLFALGGDTAGSGARRDAAGFEDQYLARDLLQQGGRNARRLPGARRRFDDDRRSLSERLADVRQRLVDRKLFAHRFHDEAEVYRPIDARQENRAKAANASVPASAPKAVAGVSFPRSASAG